jgi:hypothetical protein
MKPMTKADRDALLSRQRRASAAYQQGMDLHVEALDQPGEIGIDEQSAAYVDSAAYRQARAAYAEVVAVEDEYFRRLPRVVMAVCPFCTQALHRSFDPFGLDGFWWRSDAQPDEPAPCLHFCALLGAVDLTAPAPPRHFDVHPGPAVPFVVPRLLEHQGMTAVVSQLPLEGGVAYPIAYFAPRRPPVQTLTAGWGRTNHVYTTQLGVHGWRAAGEEMDFDLGKWIAAHRLRWCAPGTTQLGDGACPYLDLPGERGSQVISAACD